MSSLKYFKQNVTIYELSGADAQRYLQGRCTQDISKVSSSEASWSFILSPQGKIEGVFYLVKNNDKFILVTDKLTEDDSEKFLTSLFRFKVADQVFANEITENYNLITLMNNQDGEINFKDDISPLLYKVKRGSLVCYDILLEKNSENDDISTIKSALNDSSISGFKLLSKEEYEKERIVAGHPVFNKDITQEIFAPDMPLSWYVSFNKGCYAGQEVVEMATARGKPNRLFVKVKGETALSDNSSYLLFAPKSNENPNELKKAGFITSFVNDEDNNSFSAIGFLKNAYTGKELQKYAGVDEEQVFPVTIENVS